MDCKMRIYLFLLSTFILISCQKTKDEKYFYDLTQRLEKVHYNRDSVERFGNEQQVQYEKEGDIKFKIAREYIKLFRYSELYRDHQTYENDLRQIPLVFKLKNLNADRYQFISMACHLNLALKFEDASPKLGMKYIDSALSSCREMPQPFYLGHLYHAKGRLFFKEGRYAAAGEYFKKALTSYDSTEVLYRSSMYNNLAMVYDKMGQTDVAVKNTIKAITLLSSKNPLNRGEVIFLRSLKKNWGGYLLKEKKYSEAQKIFEGLYFSERQKNGISESLAITEKLLAIYRVSGQSNKYDSLIAKLNDEKSFWTDPADQIIIHQILLGHYIDRKDFKSVKLFTERLQELNQNVDKHNMLSLNKLTDALNLNVLKNLEENYDRKERSASIRFYILILIAILIIVILIMAAKNRLDRMRLSREITEKDREILETENKILQQDTMLQDMKIQSLHHNLSLKIQTERAFLERLKQLKRNEKTNSEEIIKSLQFQITNLLKIDSKDSPLLSENHESVSKFSEKLLALSPDLTPKELKLCLYFRMDVTTKEIAILLNSSDGSIRVYKTKIKNKLKLDKDDDLAIYLRSL